MNERPIKWTCIERCGACCKLAPLERVEALEVLDDSQVIEYMKMVGPDGWCRFYDKLDKVCTIYNTRPQFCRVSSIKKLFQITEENANRFSIDCCREQINSIYGDKSPEKIRFEQSIISKAYEDP